ncbi:2916_t:CDS:1, partial [Racocetra fulgida]
DTTSIETENSSNASEQTNLHCDESKTCVYTINTLAINIFDNTSNSDIH